MARINLPSKASVANCGVSGAITLNNWRVSFYYYLILIADNTGRNLFPIDSGAADQKVTNSNRRRLFIYLHFFFLFEKVYIALLHFQPATLVNSPLSPQFMLYNNMEFVFWPSFASSKSPSGVTRAICQDLATSV